MAGRIDKRCPPSEGATDVPGRPYLRKGETGNEIARSLTSVRRGTTSAPTSHIVAAIGLFCVAVGGTIAGGVPSALFLGLCLSTLGLGISLLRRARRYCADWRGLGTVTISVLAIVGIYIPGIQLVAGLRTSRIVLLGVTNFDYLAQVKPAYAVGGLAVVAFFVGEVLVPVPRRFMLVPPRVRHILRSKPLFASLMVVGVVVTALEPARTSAIVAARGQIQGQGFLVALGQCLPLGIALGIVERHWDSRRLALASVGGTGLFLIQTTSRSPLLLVAVAIAVRVAEDRKRWRMLVPKVLVPGVLGLYVVSVFIVAFAMFRGDVSRHAHVSVIRVVGTAAANPVSLLASHGSLDTFDGLTLALTIPRGQVNASIWDPLKGLTNLVPTQIWHNKPAFLSAVVSHRYTDFGGLAGIFLSGPGYLYIIWCGAIGVAVGFLLLGVFLGRSALRGDRAHLTLVVALYFVCRFLLGGDAFDILYVLTIWVGVFFAFVLLRLLQNLVPWER